MLPIIRTAGPEDLDEVIDISAECTAWLSSRGIVQWPGRFLSAQLLPSLEAGDLSVVDDEA
jgi:hypothetical protein